MKSSESGFSTIEMLVSIIIVSFLLAGLYTVLFQTQAVFQGENDAMALRQEARVAISQLSIELRLAGYDIGNLPEPLSEAEANRLAFVADIDDGSTELPCTSAFETAVDGGAERITYRLQSGDLLRSTDCWNGSAWTNEYTDQVVARNLIGTDPIFQYFDENGVELVPGGTGLTVAQRALVRMISLSLTMEDPTVQAVGKPQVSFQIGTQVSLRNTGTQSP